MQAAPPNADELLPGNDARLKIAFCGIFSNCVYLHIRSLAGRMSERVSNDSLCMNLCHFTPVCCLVVLKGRQPKACSQVAFQLIPPTSWKDGAGKKQNSTSDVFEQRCFPNVNIIIHSTVAGLLKLF